MSQPTKQVMASESLTISTSAVPLTATKYRKQVGNTAAQFIHANHAFISVESNSIRVSVDPAVTPTTNAGGHEYDDNDSFWIEGAAIRNFQAIRTGGADATIRVTYYY
jgi:hypothetical protein